MTLRNNSKKIIHVGTTVIMPGDTAPITEGQAKTPAVKALVKKGLVALDEDQVTVTDTTTNDKTDVGDTDASTVSATASDADTVTDADTVATEADNEQPSPKKKRSKTAADSE